jgi:hypothetical protein
MPKKIGSVTRQMLVNAPLPPATQTYTVISHQFVIDTVTNELKNHGFSIEKELYRCTAGAQVASGVLKLVYGDDPDLSLMYAFGNSYDKTMKFKSAIGAYVNQNDAVMISKFNDWTRKHTGSADQETVDTITKQVAEAKDYFDELKAHKDMMSNVVIDRLEFASLVGQLYFLKFITVDQVSVILREYENPSFTYSLPADNLWTCYNHILVALKRTHPKNWIDNQISIHLHICNLFKLFYYDTVDSVEDTADTADVDFKDYVEDVTEDTEDQSVVLPGYTAEDYNPDDEEELNERMDIIGQNGNDGLHYDEEQTANTLRSTDEVVATVIDKTLNPDPDGDEDFVDGVDEDIELEVNTQEEDTDSAYFTELPDTQQEQNEVENDEVVPTAVEEEKETVYFMKEDYEGVEIGDYIEEEGVYYNIINDESGDDGNFWVCVESKIDITEDTETEIELELTVEDSIPQTTVLSPEQAQQEIAAVEAAVAEVCDEPVVAKNATVENAMDPAVSEVIKSELEFLYDYDELTFTYKLEDGLYNVTLFTGETCSLAQGYIDQQL